MRFDQTARQELALLLDHQAITGNTMRLDEVQAFVCAMISGPDECDLTLWLPEITGGADYTVDENQRIRELVLLLGEDLNTQMKASLVPELILYPAEDKTAQDDYLTWCNAYLCALEYTETDWFNNTEEAFEDLIYPIAALGGVYDEEDNSPAVITFTPKELENLAEELPQCLLAIFTYWQTKKNRPLTYKRAGEKIGRNDPCACASGKKNKHCCGSN